MTNIIQETNCEHPIDINVFISGSISLLVD